MNKTLFITSYYVQIVLYSFLVDNANADETKSAPVNIKDGSRLFLKGGKMLSCSFFWIRPCCLLWIFLFSCAAARTKNYSGAELEGVVKSAVSFALNRQLSLDDLTKPVEEDNIKVTMDDFLNALQEVVPAFGASTDDLERCR